jgi:hypothetical protein
MVCAPPQTRGHLTYGVCVRIGWHTVVLNRSVARGHPLYKEFDAAIKRFPTINTREYEEACYVRWLAMAHYTSTLHNGNAAVNGGWLSDYDVLNFGFEVQPHMQPLVFWQGHIPALVSGSSDEFLRVVQTFIEQSYDPAITSMRHVSDMLLIQRQLGEQRYGVVPPSSFNVLIADTHDARRLKRSFPLLHLSHKAAHELNTEKATLGTLMWKRYLTNPSAPFMA